MLTYPQGVPGGSESLNTYPTITDRGNYMSGKKEPQELNPDDVIEYIETDGDTPVKTREVYFTTPSQDGKKGEGITGTQVAIGLAVIALIALAIWYFKFRKPTGDADGTEEEEPDDYEEED